MFLTKKLWRTLSYTWGLPMSIIGTLAYYGLTALGYKPEKNIYGVVFRVGQDWGGINLGPVSIISKDSGPRIARHEFGHSVQNCLYGPFYLLMVAVPSFCRYWYQEYQLRILGLSDDELAPYDSAWFEGQATELGELYYEAQLDC